MKSMNKVPYKYYEGLKVNETLNYIILCFLNDVLSIKIKPAVFLKFDI